MGGRGGASSSKSSGGRMSADAKEFQGVASKLESRAAKQKESALRSARREKEFYDNATAGTNAKQMSLLEAFYSSGSAQRYFMAEQREVRAKAISEAIRKKPQITRDQIAKAEVEAARDFASSKVSVPSSMTGRTSKSYPRVADMRSYFDKSGNPINLTAHDGGYSDIKKSWGKAFADEWKKRR